VKLQTENKIELLLKIQAIQIFNFSVDNSLSHQSLSPEHSYSFEINAGTLVDATSKIIGIDFIAKIFTSQKMDDKVCEIALRISYLIDNFHDFTKIKDNKLIVPENVMQHLVSITISTARGILFEKLQGSFLSNIILPAINVSSLSKIDSDRPLIQ